MCRSFPGENREGVSSVWIISWDFWRDFQSGSHKPGRAIESNRERPLKSQLRYQD